MLFSCYRGGGGGFDDYFPKSELPLSYFSVNF
jgi:hypothetical protein